MKKVSVFLSMVLLLAGGACLPANAVVGNSTSVLKKVFPDDPDFQQGLADGRAEGQALGKGNPAVQSEINDANANQQAAAAAGDTAGANYWWGYRIGLQMYK